MPNYTHSFLSNAGWPGQVMVTKCVIYHTTVGEAAFSDHIVQKLQTLVAVTICTMLQTEKTALCSNPLQN